MVDVGVFHPLSLVPGHELDSAFLREEVFCVEESLGLALAKFREDPHAVRGVLRRGGFFGELVSEPFVDGFEQVGLGAVIATELLHDPYDLRANIAAANSDATTISKKLKGKCKERCVIPANNNAIVANAIRLNANRT